MIVRLWFIDKSLHYHKLPPELDGVPARALTTQSAAPSLNLSMCRYPEESMDLERLEYSRESFATDCILQTLPKRSIKFHPRLHFDTIIEHWIDETNKPSH